jgi:hypothetical protein
MFDLIIDDKGIAWGPGCPPIILVIWLVCYAGLIAREVQKYGHIVETEMLFLWALTAFLVPFGLPILALGKTIEWTIRLVQKLYNRWMVHISLRQERRKHQ